MNPYFDGLRHSRDCTRAYLPSHYDRSGEVMLLGACTCGRDEIVAQAIAREGRLREALSDIQFDLINCHEAASRNACEHIQDAITIVNRALGDAGPQPDEIVRLQQDIDSAEEEIERLQGLLKITTTAFDVIEQDLGKLLGLTRTEQKIEATIKLARKALD